MIPFVAPVIALLVAWLGWPLIRTHSSARLAWLAVSFAFLFWYWLPGFNVLVGGNLGLEEVRPDPTIAALTVWPLLFHHLAALAAIALVARLVPDHPPRPYTLTIPEVPVGLFAVSGMAIVIVWLFAAEGPAFLLQLLTGAASAREALSYDNFSASAADSLRALLEILALYAAVMLIAHTTLGRRLDSAAALLGFAGLAIAFVGSGTRAVIMMGVVAMVLAATSGARVPPRPGGRTRQLVIGGLAATVLLIPIAAALAARSTLAVEESNPLFDLFFVNNDMFRELVFVNDQMQGYRSQSARDFILTPFTYMLPSFLGFSKAIPDHLLAFNMARTEIDLILGAGNVFPGLIGDFTLAFGPAGPLWFGLFIGTFTAALTLLARLRPGGAAPLSLQIALCAWLFFSFRNLHPGLALLFTTAFAALLLLRTLHPDPEKSLTKDTVSV
ncbi:hypothetical protein [Sandaracinobacteroides saxicola]|uniref:Oligosaccharide repeat unit polymerase n=1 Tax=Sandaracinobacteroides saxicola TaxID=2759707 RepID=A0A7G5IKL5_9SPHN|nr:hypothetical protein [Sandaracinobacteroides saxicola]QMW23907.1 hypothetical protein H3309_05395 [Sandaracinobacteroides saxicola]